MASFDSLLIHSTESLVATNINASAHNRKSPSGCIYDDNIKILATLVPDEIIYLDMNSQEKEQVYTGVLFFADVSGFTDLCEKFNSLGKGGPSKITQVLNEYVGVMVQEIMSHNGDILKFSGDAFLALWKNKEDTSMADVVHAALDCALGIQKSHGEYKTEVGIILKVKIAIAAGQIIIAVIGDTNFMVLGNTMFDVKDVGNICNAGDIIISPAVKVFMSPNHYVLENINGSQFIKVLGIGSDWSPSQLTQQFDIFGAVTTSEQVERYDDISESSDISIVVEQKDVSYLLRPSIDYAVNKNLADYLRKFIIAPVVHAVDLGEPLENLTEMRQVVIVFINIVTRVFKLKQLEELLDSTYRTICEMIIASGGCVNKVSMFDKDLMFLTIFGLRGFKHKLEAQEALYCAKRIRDKLTNVHQIISSSIGVTTGNTYCGVVGHPMRKEYTVIGRTVNKAARLMCAYPDMVSCDRQTFLASQLQARYFILQPERYLKGFKNVGPVYKFDDEGSEDVTAKEMFKTTQFPILDRAKELEIFFYLLNKRANNSDISLLSRKMVSFDFEIDPDDNNYNFLVIKGTPRQGKTRFLNEIDYYIGDDMPHVSCNFHPSGNKDYKLFQQIFGPGCKIDNVTDLNTRTKHVFRMLSPFRVPEFLCALNDLMLCQFQVSSQYSRLTEDEKVFVKKKMIKYLCKKVLREEHLITIDNIEYMDEDSWVLFREVLNLDYVFICATITTHSTLCDESKQVLDSPNVIMIHLNQMKVWYHAALMCQFLNVLGVPLELEKYVQEHSFGNPGWIESFLITLSHCNALKFSQVDRKQAFNDGIVLPQKNLLQRADGKFHTPHQSVVSMLESKSGSFMSLFEFNMEGWNIYEETFKESCEDNIKTELISICTLPSGINLQEIDTDEHMDVQMMRTYDSLNVHEQHLLKCAAVLGGSFSRYKLEYILQGQKAVTCAIAIQRLFEIHVFCCARGVYKNGGISINHHTVDPNLEKEVKCYCIGFPKNTIYEELPKYASCGYIRFRSEAFRKVCYDLLTEHQAHLYNVRAIWYLENETRRCLSCDLGYFARINGQNNDDGMKRYSIEAFPGLSKKKRDESYAPDKVTIAIEDYIEQKTGIEFEIPDYPLMQPRTFIENNLGTCECSEILTTMYTQIIEHCQDIGRYETLMNALLEYAQFSIRRNRIAAGIILISKATQLLDEKLKFIYPEPSWQIPLTRGRILTLRGILYIKRKAYLEGERFLHAALRSYNLKFPNSKTAVKTEIRYRKFQLNVVVRYFPNKYIGSNSDEQCKLVEQTAETLIALYTIYTTTAKYDKACLASVWALTEALRSDSNFYINCMAYQSIFQINIMYDPPDFIEQLEEMALEMCFRKHTRLEIYEFTAVVKMYVAIYNRRTYCDNFYRSLKLGAIIVNANTLEYAGTHCTRIYPTFVRSLIFTNQVKEAAQIILYLLKTKTGTAKKNMPFEPIKLYNLCIAFLGYTTYSLIPIAECASSFQIQLKPNSTKLITILDMKYYIGLWLWALKRQQWQTSVNIYNHIADTTKWPNIYDPSLLYTIAGLIEGLLLLAVRKINLHDIELVKLILKFTDYLFRVFWKSCQKVQTPRSRYFILKAYKFMIFGKSRQAYKYLDKARKIAESSSNMYEVYWIDHNEWAWKNWPIATEDDDWLQATSTEVLDIDWDTYNNNKPMPYFTLRLHDPITHE